MRTTVQWLSPRAALRMSRSDLDEALRMYLLGRDADFGKGRDAGVDRCRGAAEEEVPPREVVRRVTLKQVGGNPAALARPVRRRLREDVHDPEVEPLAQIV